MKDFIIESGALAIYKLLFAGYFIASAFSVTLMAYGINIDYLYFGLAGQIIITLIDLKAKLDKGPIVVKTSKILATIIEWVIGPTLAVLFCSYIGGTEFSIKIGITAFIIGGFWEILYRNIKNKVLKTTSINLEDVINTDVSSSVDENTSGTNSLDGETNPPKPPGQ